MGIVNKFFIRILTLSLLNIVHLFGYSQDLEELISLHKVSLQNLYKSRGLPDAWVYGEIESRDIERVIKGFDKKVGLIWYQHSEDTLVVFMMHPTGKIEITKSNILRDSLELLIHQANKLFYKQHTSKSPSMRGVEIEDEYEATLLPETAFNRLNQLLFPMIHFADSLEHLIIVPALNIATLPFAAFQLSEGDYLIERCSYSIVPSLFELMAQDYLIREKSFENYEYMRPQKALFIANPEFPVTPVWNFPKLPGTSSEVNNIIQLLDSNKFHIDKLEGANATAKNVMSSICTYDILYFATHGVSDPDSAMDKSFLVFSKDQNDSPFLTARNIQDIRNTCMLQARLVVLSACQTGLGVSHKAGVIGLSRAFQIAGARNVVMSLWSISDKETVILMGYFFENLKKTNFNSPHEALRQAMLKYKKDVKNNPYVWASFSIFGIPPLNY